MSSWFEFELEWQDAHYQEIKERYLDPTLADEQAGCPLFRLPADLRQEIYRLCLTTNNDRLILDPRKQSYPSWMPEHRHPDLGVPLLRTCRRIYAEVDARPLYGENAFRFSDPRQAQNLMLPLRTENRLAFKTLHLDFSSCFVAVQGLDERNADRIETILNPQLTDDMDRMICKHDPAEGKCMWCPKDFPLYFPGLQTIILDVTRVQAHPNWSLPAASRLSWYMFLVYPPKIRLRVRAFGQYGGIIESDALVLGPGEDRIKRAWYWIGDRKWPQAVEEELRRQVETCAREFGVDLGVR